MWQWMYAVCSSGCLETIWKNNCIENLTLDTKTAMHLDVTMDVCCPFEWLFCNTEEKQLYRELNFGNSNCNASRYNFSYLEITRCDNECTLSVGVIVLKHKVNKQLYRELNFGNSNCNASRYNFSYLEITRTDKINTVTSSGFSQWNEEKLYREAHTLFHLNWQFTRYSSKKVLWITLENFCPFVFCLCTEF